MNKTTITHEIRRDHRQLLAELDQIIARGNTSSSFANIKRCLTQLGAHHLAEEECVFQALHFCHHGELGEICAFHEVLDNLADTISFGGPNSKTLDHELHLLRRLISLLIDTEEVNVLTMAECEISLPKSVELAIKYRAKCDEYVRELV